VVSLGGLFEQYLASYLSKKQNEHGSCLNVKGGRH
jgi:hypothetical protein